MIWLDLLSELYNCNSVELASQILEWVDKVICTAAKNPYKFIDAMNSILKECVVADHQQQDGDSHLQITAAQVQEQRIRFAILERTAPEFLEHVDELSLLRAGTAVSEEEVLLPCSPAFLVLVMSYASDSKKLASSASAALMGQFVVRLSSDVLYSTQISASFMCRLIRHVLEQGAEKDLSQACNSEALTSWVHSRASSESEWTAKDYVMSVLSSVFRITASSPLHSLSSMNALSSIMKKAAVTPGHKTINLEPQLGASISLTFLNRNLERFVKSSRDAVISHLMTRHPSMGSVFVVFDAIKAIWVLDNDSAKSLKSPLFDGLLRHLPPSFLLANWFAAVESTPSIYSSSILKRLILGLVKKSNAVVLANQVLLELGSLLRHRNDDIQIDCAQNGVKFAFEVLEQAVVVCRNGHDGKTFLTVREMCFRSTSIQDRFMSLSHGGGSIWKEVDSGKNYVCAGEKYLLSIGKNS